jgi:hypothetical protein
VDLTPDAGALRADPHRERWDDVADWMPWRISPSEDGPLVEWVHTAGLTFDDPFFEQTVQRALRHPFRLLFGARTPLARIADDAGRAPSLPVAGIVLHMSRCGSTHVAQVLDALPRLLVLSEPGPVDTALRIARLGVPLPDGSVAGPAHVRGVVDAMARPRHDDHVACVLKLDAWAVVDLPILRAALPGVPWVFLHRDGAAVLASMRGVRGAHALPGGIPGPWPAWDAGTPAGVGIDEHGARMVAALCDAAREHAGPDGVVVDHAELPGAITEVIAPHFGIALSAADRRAMEVAAGRDAKNPALPYVERPAPPPDLVALAERWVEPSRAALVAGGRR